MASLSNTLGLPLGTLTKSPSNTNINTLGLTTGNITNALHNKGLLHATKSLDTDTKGHVTNGFSVGQADMSAGLKLNRTSVDITKFSPTSADASTTDVTSFGSDSSQNKKDSNRLSRIVNFGKKPSILRKLVGSKKDKSLAHLSIGAGMDTSGLKKKQLQRGSKSLDLPPGKALDDVDSSTASLSLPYSKKDKKKKKGFFSKRKKSTEPDEDSTGDKESMGSWSSFRNLRASFKSKFKSKSKAKVAENIGNNNTGDEVDGMKNTRDEVDGMKNTRDEVDGRKRMSSTREPVDFDDPDYLDPEDMFEYDPVWKLVNSPNADILQVLMLATDSQLLREMANGPTIPAHRSNSCSVPQNELSKTSAGAKSFLRRITKRFKPMRPKSTHQTQFNLVAGSDLSPAPILGDPSEPSKQGNKSPPTLQPRYEKRDAGAGAGAGGKSTTAPPVSKVLLRNRKFSSRKSFSEVRQSIHQRVNLEEDDLYRQVDAACRRASSKRPNVKKSKFKSKKKSRFGKSSKGKDVDVDLIEKKIAMILRAKGDAVAKDMPDLAPAVNEIVKDVAYSKFRKVMRDTLGNQPGWQEVICLVNVTRSAVNWVGKSTTSAFKIKESTLKYFEDNFSNWVLGQGGWDNMVNGGEMGAS